MWIIRVMHPRHGEIYIHFPEGQGQEAQDFCVDNLKGKYVYKQYFAVDAKEAKDCFFNEFSGRIKDHAERQLTDKEALDREAEEAQDPTLRDCERIQREFRENHMK